MPLMPTYTSNERDIKLKYQILARIQPQKKFKHSSRKVKLNHTQENTNAYGLLMEEAGEKAEPTRLRPNSKMSKKVSPYNIHRVYNNMNDQLT